MLTCHAASVCLLCSVVSAPARAESLPGGAKTRLGSARFLNLGRVFAVAFSGDSRLVAGGAWDGSVRVWEAATGKELFHIEAHKGPVQKVAFSPDGKCLASAGKLPGICLWDLPSGQLARTLGSARDSFSDVAFSADGKIAAIARGTLYLWDSAGKELWKQGGDHVHTHIAFQGSDALASIYLKPLAPGRKQTFLDNNRRNYVSTWSPLPSSKESDVRELGRTVSPSCIAFGPGGSLVALHTIIDYGRNEEIRFFTSQRSEAARDIHLAGQDVSAVCISPDGRMLGLTGDSWGSARDAKFVRVFEIATGQERCRFQSIDQGQLSLAFAPDGRTLASGSLDVTVLLWDLTGDESSGKQALTESGLEKLWNDLAKDDAALAYRSHWTLVAGAKQAVPFLARHMQPAAAPDPKRLATLIADLADKRFPTRRQASLELTKLDDLAAPALQAALGASKDLEVRRRLEELLKRIGQPSPSRLRQLRAVEALEHMGTPAAALLRQLATGCPMAALTRAAGEAYQRLGLERP